MPPRTVPLLFLPLQLRTDAEKRSLVESGLSWYSEDGKASHKLNSSSYDTGSLKTEAPSKWRKKPPSLSEEPGGKGELKKPQSLGQPGSFKKGRNPPIGVTSPITHTSQSTLKVAGETCYILTLNLHISKCPIPLLYWCSIVLLLWKEQFTRKKKISHYLNNWKRWRLLTGSI